MSISERMREIFPTKWYSLFFLTYILLYIFNAILIRLSRRTGGTGYDYDTTSVILVTELTKLAIASAIYLHEGHTVLDLGQQIVANRHQALFYLIPAILYCIYNNLTYVSLSYFDPTTYYILLQFRIAVTGVIYQIIFQRLLSRAQWISLLLLTLGCIIKQMGAFDLSKMNSGKIGAGSFFNGALLLIAVQILCSCLAGVYNEYLLKKQQSQPTLDKPESKSSEVHLMIQNCFMYIDSFLCNLLVVTYNHSDVAADKPMFNFDMFCNPLVLVIIFVSAFCGLSTSYFIKMFNSIMKAYTTGIELLLTAVICFWLFSTPLDSFTLISIVVISYASYLFARNPVLNRQAPV